MRTYASHPSRTRSAGWTRPRGGRSRRRADPRACRGVTPLDPRESYKPLDFGNGIVAGSLAPSGRLVSLGMANPKIGRLWLTATDPFPESSRGDEDAVRRHRAALAAPDRPSFGLSLLEVRANASGLLVLALAFGRDTDQAVAEVRSLARDASDVIDREVRSRRALWTGLGLEREAAHPVRRGVAYALDCAASRITERAIAIITDHEILPLVWTRDAYYICRALLGAA